MLRSRQMQHPDTTVNSAQPAGLGEILNYRNENVVGRFAEQYSISEQDAEEIFTETKRWLWLCAKRTRQVEAGSAESFQLPLFNEAFAIDMMWHTFILFTEDYARFCQTYFGFFIHHHPKTKAERQSWSERIQIDREEAWRERRQNLEKIYNYLFDELGPEILIKWCEDFPQRFKTIR
jgi:hypothetical protein